MLFDENTVTFSEAAKKLPSINGRKPHVSTICRWASRGIQGVRLETRRIGGRTVTSLEALERFSKALAEAPQGTVSREQKLTHAPTEPERRRAVKNCSEFLEQEGI